MSDATIRDERADLEEAVNGLALRQPVFSAGQTFSTGQLRTIAAIALVLLAGFVLIPLATGIFLVSIALAWYLVNTFERAALALRGLDRPELIRIDDATALAIPDDELPVYTILLPAFGEPEIMRELIRGVGALNYPKDKLDIKLLLEADDTPTVEAAERGGASAIAEVVLVPPAEPRTKPKACNYGLLRARGSITTIYDAEDLPEPLQLRRVVAALRDAPPEVACVQGRLAYFNERQNLLTRWFSAEYDQWFGFVLPALSQARAPIPLGGTSNHVRTDVLVAAGAWDPFNVTEDADLGMRLARMGYRTAVLDSITLEEANSDPVNWVRQRSRWYKGYLQTFLVHTREPRRTIRELGWRGFVRFTSIMLGTPTANLINAVFVSAGVFWYLDRPPLISHLLPTTLYFISLICLVFGNAATLYVGVITTRAEGKSHLLFSVFLSPLYWALMSAAAAKGLLQLVFQPSYWEKTVHGLAATHEGPSS